jgi:penicillin-binding protein 2
MARALIFKGWLLLCIGLVSAAHAETEKSAAAEIGAVPKGPSDGAIVTRKDARAITLKIPAPRGMIVDRHGEPLAQNAVAYQIALQFRQFEKADRAFVIDWARTRLNALAETRKDLEPKTDDEIYDHYVHRRWLPLMVSGQIAEKEALALEGKLPSGVVLNPLYRRYYPEGELAAHVIGYSGSVGKLPTGPINFNEPLWEESEGRAGLEKIYNEQLTGDAGMKKLLFDENGNKLLEEQVKRPRPGGTLVTTIDLKWQRLAEKILRGGCKRGAFVVVDVVTGEVLVMASRPSFDLNSFIPGISNEAFKQLQEEPSQPLFGRAFQSAYPPASSFKPIVALVALNNGVVTENSTIYCPAAMTVGKKIFNNWSDEPEGSINVKRAIARSCNTWFYQVGIDIGPTSFLSLARRLGFGEKSGLPLIGETPGLVPNDEWMLKNERRRILDGDTANMSIGQGSLLASPLQVAQAMAGIANGWGLPKLRLISQLQDTRGYVVQALTPERKNMLGLNNKAVQVVHQGMSDVVHSGYGTGQSAALGYAELCAKTGTAQWGLKSKGQRLAWFAGFMPRANPRYAFAVLYEGRPGEKVSGGRMAAPMVQKFFSGIKDEIKEVIEPPKKALVVVDEESGEAVEPAPPVVQMDVIDEMEEEEEVDGVMDVAADGRGVIRALPVDEVDEASAMPQGEFDHSARYGAMPAMPLGEDDEVMDENVEDIGE